MQNREWRKCPTPVFGCMNLLTEPFKDAGALVINFVDSTAGA
jgi:hypothetical protein